MIVPVVVGGGGGGGGVSCFRCRCGKCMRMGIGFICCGFDILNSLFIGAKGFL